MSKKITKGTMEQLTTLSEINQIIDDLLLHKKNLSIITKDGCRPIASDCPRTLIDQSIVKQKIVPLIIKLLEETKFKIEEEIRTRK